MAVVPRALLGLTVLLAGAVGTVAATELEATNAPSVPPVLRAEMRLEAVPDLPPVRRVFVTAGTNESARFAFGIPEAFRLDPAMEDGIALVSADFNSLITLRLASPMVPDAQGPSRDYWRARLLGEHPGTKVVDELTLSAANQSGPAFDLHWKTAGGLERLERVAYTACAAGILEFRLSSSTNAFAKARYDFNYVMLTFRASDAHGKLDLPKFSNKF